MSSTRISCLTKRRPSVFAAVVILVSSISTLASADLYVVNGESNSISRIDPDTGAVLSTIPTPVPTSFPADALASSGESLFYTNFYTSTIYEIDPTTGEVRNSFSGPGGVGSLGFGRTSFGPTLFALSENEGKVSLLDPTTGAVFSTFTPDESIPCPLSMDVNTATNRLFMGSCAIQAPHLYELLPTRGTVVSSFFVPGEPLGVAFDGGRLFAVHPMAWPGDPDVVDNIIEIDPGTGTIIGSLPTPDARPDALAGSPVPAPELPVCSTTFDFTGDTLTVDFELGAEEPTVWSVSMFISTASGRLWSVSLPAIEPTVSVPVPIPDFPQVGPVGFLSTLVTQQGIVCSDWKVLDTGPLESPSVLQKLRELLLEKR
jgi:YVTN family beta-propeller protein